jgi:hypothetical protein
MNHTKEGEPMADDLMMMQRQAARRVQQMQEHSRRVFEAHQSECATPPKPSTLPHLESEQWLLLGLALLLMRCGGRTELTLALLYLAL